MACDQYRQTVLEVATDNAGRCRIALALAHVASCESCRAVFADFDRIAAALKTDAEPSVQDDGNDGPIWDVGEPNWLQESADGTGSGAERGGTRPGGQLGTQTVAQTGTQPNTQPNTQLVSIGSAERSGSIYRLAGKFGLFAKVAAALVLTVGAFWFGKRSVAPLQNGQNRQAVLPGPASNQTGFTVVGRSADAFAIGPSEITHDTGVFERVSRSLDGRAQWVLVSAAGTSRELGYSNEPLWNRGSDTDTRVDVLKLVLLLENKIISSVDLVIVPGQAADLTLMLPAGNSVHYRAGTSSGDLARLNLKAEIQPTSGNRPIAALSTTLNIRQNSQLSAGVLQTESGRYELCSAFSRSLVAGTSAPTQAVPE